MSNVQSMALVIAHWTLTTRRGQRRRWQTFSIASLPDLVRTAERQRRWKSHYRDQYHKFWREEVKKYRGDAYYAAVLDLLPVQAGDKVLECGIGTGETLSLPLARRGAVVHGVDLAEPLLTQCRRQFAEEGCAARGAAGDIETLPFADESFDWVVCVSTTWYLPDFPRALREMLRVTRRGGALVFDVMNAWHPFQLLIFGWAHLYNSLRVLKRSVEGRDLDGCGVMWTPRAPTTVRRALNGAGADVTVKGFFVLLPLALPLLEGRGNLCRYFPLFAFGLQDAPVLRWLGGKLLFVCRKREG